MLILVYLSLPNLNTVIPITIGVFFNIHRKLMSNNIAISTLA